jgi:hypothetical protein
MPSILQDLEELKFQAVMADCGPIRPTAAAAKPEPELPRRPSITDFLPKKSPPLQPEITNAVATSCEVDLASEALSTSPSDAIPVLNPVRSIDEEDTREDGAPSGNSLGAGRGWSTDFEPDILPDVHLHAESHPIAMDRECANSTSSGFLFFYFFCRKL